MKGMVIGMHNRDNDLTVNALKAKQLNKRFVHQVRRSSITVPTVILAFRTSLEFIDNDELVWSLPQKLSISVKSILTENDRKRSPSRGPKDLNSVVSEHLKNRP